MTTHCRLWWRNCALHPDSEIMAIDEMEDRIAPVGASVSKIRDLISSLELCHHKAERWVEEIIRAIGVGESTKGLGTRSPGQQHPSETVWQEHHTGADSPPDGDCFQYSEGFLWRP